MRDYVKEMLDAWSNEGEEAAYVLGSSLLVEIENDREHLTRQEAAILALGRVLRDRAGVETVEFAEEHKDRSESSPELDTIEQSERPRLIAQAAREVWEDQQEQWAGPEKDLVKTQDVRAKLQAKDLDLGVQQPLAVIGTVLASADGFTKIARNTFEYALPSPSDDAEDLPW